MEYLTLQFTAAGQELTNTTGPACLASDTIQYVHAAFTLDDTWSSYASVSALWTDGEDTYATVLDTNDSCVVPLELLADVGAVRVNLVGFVAENDVLTERMTTWSVMALKVMQKVDLTGLETEPITPSQYEQFVAAVSQYATNAETAQEAAEDAQEAAEDAAELAEGYKTTAVDAKDAAVQAETDAEAAQDAAEDARDIAVAAKDAVLGMTVGADTLAAGSSATVSYQNGHMQFGIPRGDKGAKGDQGVQGLTGATGATGATGNGIYSIYKTGENGAVKTYTILFTDGTTTTFDVTDGEVTNAVLSSTVDSLEALIYKAFITNTAEGEIASFNDGADGIPVVDLVANIEPVQSGSGDPSPNNVRPITGWTDVVLTKAGKNLLNIADSEQGGIDASGNLVTGATLWRATDYIDVVEGATYTFSANTTNTLRLYYYDANKTFMTRVQASDTTSMTVTIPSGVQYIKWTIYKAGATLTSAIVEGYELQIEAGSSATAYEAYIAPTTTTISLGQTVYGGTLDVTTGVLTVDRAMITLNGTQSISIVNWRATSTSVGWVYPWSLTQNVVKTSDSDTPKVIADSLKTITYGEAYAGSADTAITTLAHSSGGTSYGLCVRMDDTTLTTASAINTYLASNPITVCYELATPTTVQLTATEVTTLLGDNNIWADSGTVEVTYRADPTIYIANLTGADDDMVADANIPSGDYFVVNDKLYLATAAIAQGASIVVGTNCTETSIAEALNALN